MTNQRGLAEKSSLAALFPSMAMARLVIFFAVHPGARYHVRELSRLTSLSSASLQHELKRLAHMGALVREDEGARAYYRADESHPAWRAWFLLLRAGALTEENTFTLPIQETVACNPSGSTDINRTATIGLSGVETGMSMEADVSVRHEACAYRMENGAVIKITGDPDLDVHMTMAGSADGELTDLHVTEIGAFHWTRGGASGRCAVDLSSLLNAATQMVTVTGTFCGFPVSETFPVEG